MEKLETGEQYLTISIKRAVVLDAALSAIANGEEQINIPAFVNKEKKGENSPDYRSTGVAVWVNTKKTQNENKPPSGVVEINHL